VAWLAVFHRFDFMHCSQTRRCQGKRDCINRLGLARTT